MTRLHTDEELEKINHGWEEMFRVLSRPPGADLTELQEARADRVIDIMKYRSLREGEGWEILTGQRDHELGFAPPQAHRANPRTSCKDCGAALTPENKAGSDPARCRDCRRLKKRRENEAYRGRP